MQSLQNGEWTNVKASEESLRLYILEKPPSFGFGSAPQTRRLTSAYWPRTRTTTVTGDMPRLRQNQP